jgi:hypothetical protein
MPTSVGCGTWIPNRKEKILIGGYPCHCEEKRILAVVKSFGVTFSGMRNSFLNIASDT